MDTRITARCTDLPHHTDYVKGNDVFHSLICFFIPLFTQTRGNIISIVNLNSEQSDFIVMAGLQFVA